MEFNLNINQAQLAQVFEALGEHYKYQSQILQQNEDMEDVWIDNPETIDVFCKRMIIEHIKEIVEYHLITKGKNRIEEEVKTIVDSIEII